MTRFILALMAGLFAAMSSHTTETSNRPEVPARDLPRAIDAFSGTWLVTETYPPSATLPRGGTGHGTETWRAGPGGVTLVYEYHSKNPNGQMYATAVLWWDRDQKRLRELWCTNRNTSGCVVSNADIRWKGNELVFDDAYEVQGRHLLSREVWTDITSKTHTMIISEGAMTADMKPWIVSHAVRSP